MNNRNGFGFRWMPLLCGVVFSGTVLGQGTTGVEKFEPGKFPGYVVDEVVVPVPSEIFAVLDKLGNPNWKDEVRKIKIPDTSNRLDLSLVFGAVVAEGFVAVQAGDKLAVEQIGRDVITLATSLGIKDAVLPHAKSILDAVKREDWKAVRKELDLTQSTVRREMDRLRDSDLAQCVSLAGWLRGTASVTSVVSKAYTTDRAELLNQPLLVEHFAKSMRAMSGLAKKNPNVKALETGLTKIRNQMETPDGNISQEKVNAMKATSEELLQLILKTSKAKGN